MPTPDFILELRAKVGHDPLWLPGVTALVEDGAGRVLVGRRTDNGLWALPSGIPEPGEPMAAACEREVREETGLTVTAVGLVSVQTVGPVVYPNRDVCWFVDHFFRCSLVAGTAHVADDESSDVGWFAPDGVPAPRSPRLADLLSLAAQHGVHDPAHFDRAPSRTG